MVWWMCIVYGCGVCRWYLVVCFLLSPFVVIFSVWWGKANGSCASCAPKFSSACRCFASQTGYRARPRVVRRVCPVCHRQVVPVACMLQCEEDPEGIRAFGAVEWGLAPLRVDLETGKGSLLASSSGGIDPDEGVVYSWGGACSRV